MAEIDLARFAGDVKAALDRERLTYRAAEMRWPGLEKSALSRAVNGKPINAANFVVVTRSLGLDGAAYVVPGRRKATLAGVVERAVSRVASRETSGAEGRP